MLPKNMIHRFQDGFGLMETFISLGIIATVVIVILVNSSDFFIWNDAMLQRKKLDVNKIADAYITKALGANAYSPLTEADFPNGQIPTPPDSAAYQGLLSNKSEFFKVCTPLNPRDNSLNCMDAANSAKCYCRASQNADLYASGAQTGAFSSEDKEPAASPQSCVSLKQLPPPVLSIYDSFDRADSTSTLGKTNTGHSWLTLRGIWGISGHAAYVDTIFGNESKPANTLAVVETGKPDGILEVTLANNVQDARIAFRVVDEYNNYFVERNVLGYHIEKTVQGIRFELTPKVINTSFVNGDRVKVEMRGPCVYVFVNNSLLLQINDSTFTTGKHGMGIYQNKEVKFDNFSFRYP